MSSGKTVTTKKALLTSFFVDVVDIITNLVVAFLTGSVVMVAETMEGLADVSSVSLLLIGNKRSQKKADHKYQFGYGKELYFWALLAAVVILMITATLSFYLGFQKFMHPEPVQKIWLAYGVLTLGLITNAYALWMSMRVLLGNKKLKRLPKIFMESSLLAPKTTFVLDVMGTSSSVFGLVSLIIYGITGDERFDGLGAMVMAVILAFFAIVLLGGVRSLITGRSVPKPLAKDIRKAALKIPGVLRVLDLRTMILGASSTLVNLEVHLDDDLTTDEIEKIIDKIKVEVGRVVPGYTHVQVEPETPGRNRKQKPKVPS